MEALLAAPFYHTGSGGRREIVAPIKQTKLFKSPKTKHERFPSRLDRSRIAASHPGLTLSPRVGD
jgi:hypothetical protein